MVDLLGEDAAQHRPPLLERDRRVIRDRREELPLVGREGRVPIADELADLPSLPAERQANGVPAGVPLGPRDLPVLEDERGAGRADGVHRRPDDRAERLLEVKRLRDRLGDPRKRLELRDPLLRVLVELRVLDRLRDLACDRHQELDLVGIELSRLLRPDVQGALEPLLRQDGHGQDRLVLLLPQVRKGLEARVEVRVPRDHDRRSLRGRCARDALADPHLRNPRQLLDPRPARGPEHELVRGLVVEIDEAGVGVEGLGHLGRYEVEELAEVERGVDRRDGLQHEPEMARGAIHESDDRQAATAYTRFVPTCGSCGSDNPEGFRFCGSCGALLVEEPSTVHESRRTVTVVFCDVTGSTALGERLDPESLRGVMARYFEAMRLVIERHGGTVEKFIGDAVMAVFGVPTLHEDDAVRAVRAAAGMREALAELNEELERDFGTRLLLRTGVNTGEVVAGTEERLATGDAINVAARLEQAAEPGEILIGPDTYALVRDAVEVEALPPLELKGKSAGLAPYRLRAVGADAPGRARRFDAPLVGRERERRLLADAWERVVTERSCSLFTLLGSAGVGKSRLVAEFLSEIDAKVSRGRCLSYGEGITYWPVVEVLLQLLDGRATDPDALGVDEPVAARIAALLGEDASPSSPEETAWAVRKLFEARAADSPLVVVLDDIHWGEATFLDLVEHVAGLSRGAPIFLLCIARPELLDSRPTWGGGLLNATTVLLEPLSIHEADELIGQLLGDSRLDIALRSRIRETAGGNPLFLEEMLAMLREDSANDDVRVPPTIHALLAARLDQLDRAERGVLESGSVEGEVFHRGAVQALAPAEPEIDSRLTTLVRKELIRPDRPTLPGEEAYRFRHLLIRDAAYDALPKAARARLHESFARWLDDHADSIVELDEIVGYHFEQAYRYRQELGPLDDAAATLAEQAAERLARGGTTALTRGDVRAAETLLRRATSLFPEQDSRRPELLLELADALFSGGRLADSRAVVEEAITLSRRHDDEQFLARARLQQIEIAGQTDPTDSTEQSLAETEALLRELERVDDTNGLARAWGLVGRLRFFRGRAAAAEEAFARAVTEARRAENTNLERQAYEWWAGAKCFGPAPVRQGLEFIDAVPQPALKSAQLVAFLAEVHSNLSAMEGRFDEARTHVARAKRITDEFGLELRSAGLAQFSGRVEALAGDLQAAEREFRQGYELLGELGETGFRSTTGVLLAEVLVAQGRDAEAELIVAEVGELAQEDDLDPQARTRAVRALLLERQGRHDDALRLAREAVALFKASDYFDAHADMLVTLATILRAADHRGEAQQALKEALDLYERKGNLVMAGRVHGLLSALVASSQG